MIRVISALETCQAAPYQVEAKTADGRSLYVWCRSGLLIIVLGDIGEPDVDFFNRSKWLVCKELEHCDWGILIEQTADIIQWPDSPTYPAQEP